MVQHRGVRPATAGAFGNAGRNTIVGPGISNVDAPIIRTCRVMGTRTLQLRFEAFNALNNPIWNDPNTTALSSQYGSINSTRRPMRELQLGVKMIS